MLEIVKSTGSRRTTCEHTSTDVATRVIPCLDVDAGRVVRSQLRNLRDAGDPVELAAAYLRRGADELTFLDVTASSSGPRHRRILEWSSAPPSRSSFHLRRSVAGVRAVEDVDVLLRAGADKVSVNTAAIARPELLAEMSRQFGSPGASC